MHCGNKLGLDRRGHTGCLGLTILFLLGSQALCAPQQAGGGQNQVKYDSASDGSARAPATSAIPAPSAAGGAALTPDALRADTPSAATAAMERWVQAAPARQVDGGKRPPIVPAGAVQPAGPIQGVSADEVKFGMANAFTGSAKETGHNLKVGVEVAFAQINESGGVYGRHLTLATADDGYEPSRTAEAMAKLNDQDKVFGFIGEFGTPTAAEIGAPFALAHREIFFGAMTGSPALRHDPPDRYVFNFRPGYADETETIVKYLVLVRHIKPEQIVVFAQDDSFGDAGYLGVQKGMRALRGENAPEVLRLGYKRNTIDIAAAMKQFMPRRKLVKAVIIVGTYRAAATFIEKTHDVSPQLIYANVSGVGSTSLADELMLLGPSYASGVIVTQVVPAVDSYATAVLDYKAALAKYAPGEKPDYVSFEGYVVGKIMILGLQKAGMALDQEKLVDALEQIHDIDLGFGTPMGFHATKHQASSKVWGTVLTDQGRYQPLDLQ